MKKLVWRCVCSPGFVADGIRFVSRGNVCHVEFVFGKETIGAHAQGGVLRRPLNKYAVEFWFEAELTDEQYAAAVQFLEAQLGKPYDFNAIIGMLIDRDWRDPSKWFCSELWAATLEASGAIHKLASPVNKVTPEDALLISSASFEVSASTLTG